MRKFVDGDIFDVQVFARRARIIDPGWKAVERRFDAPAVVEEDALLRQLRQRIENQPAADGDGREMDIQRIAAAGDGIFVAPERRVKRNRAFKGFGDALVPIADAGQNAARLRRNRAVGHGADVEEVVSAHGEDFVELAGQIAVGKIVLVAPVAPAHAPHGLARLGGAVKALAVGNRALRRRIVAFAETAVVDQNLRLQLPHQLVNARVVNLRRDVPEQRRDFAIARQKLGDLALDIGDIAAHVRLVCRARRDLVRAFGVIGVGMVPVGDRVVEAEGHVLLGAGRGELADDVAAERRVRDLIVRLVGVPHAEAVVVLGGDAEIAHPDAFGERDNFPRVEAGRVEALGKLLVFLAGNLHDKLILLVKFGERVNAPVEKQPEPARRVPVSGVDHLENLSSVFVFFARRAAYGAERRPAPPGWF